MTNPDDHAWMLQAIDLAKQSLYLTAPNPRVGCIIVRDGRILGAGATQAAGGPHAEVMALRDMQQRKHNAHGSAVYVTLEPCSHHGRTPPCVDALIAAQPERVVVAMRDPNPMVAGRGLAKLRAAGIAVTVAVCAEQALTLNPGFVARMTRKVPWVWLKLAASLDGRAALNNGVSQWITGPEARADGHHWRARSCVVLTGLGTILADDPQLNVRLVSTPRQPIRAVVDPRFEIPEQARIIDGGPIWLFTARPNAAKAERLRQRNVTTVVLPQHSPDTTPEDADATYPVDTPSIVQTGSSRKLAGADRVDLMQMLGWMAQHEINEVHVECGPGLAGAMLEAGCVDELLVYMAPLLLGDAQPMVRLPCLETLEQARRFEFFETMPLGADVRLRARVHSRWQTLLDAV